MNGCDKVSNMIEKLQMVHTEIWKIVGRSESETGGLTSREQVPSRECVEKVSERGEHLAQRKNTGVW